MIARSLVLIIPFLMCGCGGGGGLPAGDTGTVSGTVTYNSQPVPAGSTVVFVKQGGGAGVSGNGATDASGNYQLSMRDGNDILVGVYSVGVAPPPEPELSPEQMMEQGMKEAENAKPSASPAPPEEPTYAFPAKYVSPETSGLKFEVKAGENRFDIQMGDDM